MKPTIQCQSFRIHQWIVCGLIGWYLIFGYRQSAFAQQVGKANAAIDGEAEFLAVWQAVNERFYRADFNGVDWAAAKEKYLPLARQAKSHLELSPILNEMLGLLHTSHTAYFTAHDTEYFYLCDLFFPFLSESEGFKERFPEGRVLVDSIGLLTRKIEGRWFVVGALDGSPAAEAGMHRGNELVSVDGLPFQPIDSFAGKANTTVHIVVQETDNPDSRRTVKVKPTRVSPQESMMAGLEKSIQTFERKGRQIGYLHLWSYAGKQFHDRLVQEVVNGSFKDADALIVDIRDGWGGASPEYLNLFNRDIPQMSGFNRQGEQVYLDTQWRKPVALLINGGSRSGKETIAYGFRKHKIGPVVGERTAGAVSAGTVIPIGNSALLYLCVSGVKVDGEILEGIGVPPDFEIPFPLPYAPASDPQLEKAVELLSDK